MQLCRIVCSPVINFYKTFLPWRRGEETHTPRWGRQGVPTHAGHGAGLRADRGQNPLCGDVCGSSFASRGPAEPHQPSPAPGCAPEHPPGPRRQVPGTRTAPRAAPREQGVRRERTWPRRARPFPRRHREAHQCGGEKRSPLGAATGASAARLGGGGGPTKASGAAPGPRTPGGGGGTCSRGRSGCTPSPPSWYLGAGLVMHHKELLSGSFKPRSRRSPCLQTPLCRPLGPGCQRGKLESRHSPWESQHLCRRLPRLPRPAPLPRSPAPRSR